MVKVLSRDAVQRMTGRKSSSAVNIGGGSGDASGVSRAWVEENYISKAFFETLFTIHGTRTYIDEETEQEVTEEVVITPNGIADGEEYKLSNVEVSVGLWTKQFLSALGLNPGGGGGGGATALTELVDVTISNPQNGQALIYNSTAGKWVNGDITPDLSAYATKTWVQQGYLPLTGGTMQNTTLVTNLNADMLDGRHGDGYAMIGVLGTVIEQETDLNDILNAGTYTCMSGADASTLDNTPYTGGNFRLWHIVNTGTDGNTGQQWSSQIMLAPNEARMFIRSHNTSAFGEWKEFAYLTSNVASATKLQTPHTIWGQTFDGTNNVSGLISGASGIKLNQTGNGYGYIDFHYASSSAYTSNIYEKSSGLLVINDLLNIIKGGNVGINTASPSYKLHVSGTFHASGNSSIGGTLGVTGAATLSSTLGVTGLITANGGITIPNGKTLTIGDAVLSWDSTNQGIKITKGLYSETFISALGANSSGGGGGATALTELVDVTISKPQNGQTLIYNSTTGKWNNGQAAVGSVTSVAMSVPTGFTVSGSPITTSGTLALSFAAGYSLPTTAKQNQWDAKQDAISDLATIRSNASHGQTAYNWGNHANAGYATQTWVTDKGYITSSALTGYATQQWVQQGYVTIETAQTVSGNKTFSGTITPTGGIVPRATGSVNTHNAADNSKLVIKQASASLDETPNNGLVFEWGTSGNWVGQLYFGDNGTQGLYWGGWTYTNNVLTRNEWVKLAFVTDNVASATKLQTARTIWGQSFDGTGNVSGDITDASNIFAKGDYLLLSSGKSKYGLMVESTSWGENRDCAFGFHAATSGHDIAWSTRSGQNDICLDLVIDPNNTVAKRYTRVYDALCIGDGMIVWDSANNALKVIKINGDAANFYATGGVSALGIS